MYPGAVLVQVCEKTGSRPEPASSRHVLQDCQAGVLRACPGDLTAVSFFVRPRFRQIEGQPDLNVDLDLGLQRETYHIMLDSVAGP